MPAEVVADSARNGDERVLGGDKTRIRQGSHKDHTRITQGHDERLCSDCDTLRYRPGATEYSQTPVRYARIYDHMLGSVRKHRQKAWDYLSKDCLGS